MIFCQSTISTDNGRNYEPVIVSPLPIRPASNLTDFPFTTDSYNEERLQRKEDEEARAELLEIMGSSQAPFSTVSDFSAQCLLAPSPVYRTLNPLPHDALFSATAAAAALITVQQAVAAVAAAASTAKSESAMIHGGDIENERSLLLQQQSATGSLS